MNWHRTFNYHLIPDSFHMLISPPLSMNMAVCIVHSADNLSNTIRWAALLSSSEYLWMLLSGHTPLSARQPGMGFPVLSPCSRLPSSLALHPTAVCSFPVPGCDQDCCCYGRKMVGQRKSKTKNSTREKVGEQSRKENPYRRKMDVVFKAAQLHIQSTNSLRWKRILAWWPRSDKGTNQNFKAWGNKDFLAITVRKACLCVYTGALKLVGLQ